MLQWSSRLLGIRIYKILKKTVEDDISEWIGNTLVFEECAADLICWQSAVSCHAYVLLRIFCTVLLCSVYFLCTILFVLYINHRIGYKILTNLQFEYYIEEYVVHSNSIVHICKSYRNKLQAVIWVKACHRSNTRWFYLHKVYLLRQYIY